MELPKRIKLIISENVLNQKEFAQSINVSESYISKLLRGESGLSKSTAALIQERYGYSVDWILSGTGPQMDPRGKSHECTPIQRKVISEVEQMNDADLAAVMAFISILGEYKKSIGVIGESTT